MKKKDLGIYIHIPFCERKCLYCDFCSSVGTPQEINWYMRKLMTEIGHFQALGNLYQVRTIFFGGGGRPPCWIRSRSCGCWCS